MGIKRGVYFISENIAIIFLVFVGTWAVLTTCMRAPTYMEIDSYALPIISIQHRGSIIMEPQDIEQAREDFPSLYRDVYEYNDLRVSKLNQIDDTHWVAYYFPIYAMVCIPVKLLLTFFRLNQEQAFTLTNALFFIIALYSIFKYYREKDKENLLCAILMCCCPVLYYIQYIGAEPFMFSMAIISFLLWRKKQYKKAALIISATCMMNPTFMGIGIVMFLEYLYTCFKDNKSFYREKGFIKNTLLLCLCYVPSLIPFIFNKLTIGVWNPTMRTALLNIGDTIGQRFLAYLFDLNFGIAAISVANLVLFIAAIIYSVIKKNIDLIFQWISVLFVIFCFSIMNHINCGMYMCARYLIWIYPGVIFVICDFIFLVSKNKNFKSVILSGICVLNCILVAFCNGVYTYIEFSNVSKFVLDRVPEAYISFCDSTFNSRTNHVDGGYNPMGITIYNDSDTGEIRKIMYYNTAENRELLLSMVESEQDKDLMIFRDKINYKKENEICYINNSRYANTQYIQKYTRELYDCITQFAKVGSKEISREEVMDIANGLVNHSEEAYKMIYDLIPVDEMTQREYIHWIYVYLMGREETVEENDALCNAGISNYEILVGVLDSYEFNARIGIKMQ